jgi:hypothetical protein
VDPRPRVQEGIAAAHTAAKDAALAVLEEHAAFTRTGTDGVAQIATRGLIAAEFEHWDSRAGDPNLHTHVAVYSKVMGIDGTWRALDGRPLHSAAVAISEIYNTVFEAELTARLGVTYTARPGTPDGREPVREIAGVPTAMVENFSRRRAAIDARYAELERAYRKEHGREPDAGAVRRLARQANLETREGKRPPAALGDKRAAWREELTGRFGSDALARLMSVVPDVPVTDATANAPAAADCADLAERTVAAVSARRSTWTVWNVRAEVERQLRKRIPALPPDRHRETADAITEAALARSVCVEPPSLHDEPVELRRPDGESVFTQHAAARYTSQPVLDAETHLVAAARTLTAAGLSGPAVAAALAGFEARTGAALDPRPAPPGDRVRSRLPAPARGHRSGRGGQDDRDARPRARAEARRPQPHPARHLGGSGRCARPRARRPRREPAQVPPRVDRRPVRRQTPVGGISPRPRAHVQARPRRRDPGRRGRDGRHVRP